MKKAIWLLLLTTLLACGPTTTDTQPATIDAEAEADTAVATREEPAETSENTAPSDPATAETADLDDFSPAATVEVAAQIRPQDWQKGSADPIVVIIEYGDFQ